jgi:hypothetical protein
MSANCVALEQDKRLKSMCIHLFPLLLFDCSIQRSGVKEDHTAQWFSHENEKANESRERLASDSLEMLIQWLKDGGNVGIHGSLLLGQY